MLILKVLAESIFFEVQINRKMFRKIEKYKEDFQKLAIYGFNKLNCHAEMTT